MNLTNAIRPSRWWEWIVGKFARRHKPLGPRGEAYAARYLQKHGMRIIARNRRKYHGEIDLIAIDGHFLVFVEVRTRASEEFMTPERSVRFAKKRTVAKTVRQLMRKHRNKGLQPRIDLIAIIWPDAAKEPTSIRHHRAAIPVAPW